MRRIIEFTPAFDKRDEGYGIHGVDLQMYLKGDKGIVQFVLHTNWHLPHIQDELIKEIAGKDGFYIETILTPTPASLGCHSYKPRYEGQKCIDTCSLLDGHKCYYDSSGLAAKRIYRILLKEGSEGVWRELEQYYHEIFSDSEEIV